MPYIYRFLILLASFMLCLPTHSQNNNIRSQLGEAFHTFGNDAAVINANWTVYVRDVTAGETILAHNVHQPVIPASIQKLITTAAAVEILGSDHHYETLLQHDGSLDRQGVLNGNLYITGSGDPSFGSSLMDDTLSLDHVFQKWTDLIKKLGVNEINGHIIADERIFDFEMVPRRWLWEHIGNYFGAGTSGLSANENEYTVFFAAGPAVGSPAAVVKTEPKVPEMTFINEVTTGPAGSGDQVYIFGAPWTSQRHLTGTVPLGAREFEVRGSMPDPPGFVAESFLHYLINNGIRVSGQSTSYRMADTDGIYPSEDRTTLDVQDSPFFFDVIYRTNHYSVNSYAESLLKGIAANTGEQGSTREGIKVLTDFWQSKGVDTEQMVLYDGSGLSPSNRITAAQLIAMLDEASRHPAFSMLYHSLPLAGYSGSLTNLFRGSDSEGQLRAKSGYMNGVRSYAGYTTMQNGHLAAFVIVANDYAATPAAMRHKMVRLMDAITRHNGQAINF